MAPPKMTILADHPSRSEEDDFLDLESRLGVVFDILRHRQTRAPITIAIYGDWGTGKTSAMHWLARRLGTGIASTRRPGTATPGSIQFGSTLGNFTHGKKYGEGSLPRSSSPFSV